jgi:hypothetical protein
MANVFLEEMYAEVSKFEKGGFFATPFMHRGIVHAVY